ncbi:MAG: response regulator [Ferruginibacter sp.]|nr:response regulator [Ferruginibacter sp.]
MEGYKIMVADDDPGIIDAVVMMLEFEGFEVSATLNGAQVLSMTDLPDLILLDIWMSGEDGRDICRSLKGNDRTKNIPVIMFSASSKLKNSAVEAGADDFIEKPFDFEELTSRIRKLLSQPTNNAEN